MPLSHSQTRLLRGQCHTLHPVVMIAERGLSDGVRTELNRALADHELIKVKLRAGREQRARWIEQIRSELDAELVQRIGQIACFYRRNPERPRIDPGP